MDPHRKRNLLQFLHEAGLIVGNNNIIGLIGADLREAYLKNWEKLKVTPYLHKLHSFVSEHAKWVVAGFPTRSETEVNEIMDICLVCDHVKAGATKEKLTCSLCGCTCKRTGKLQNKAAMATAHCPLSKW